MSKVLDPDSTVITVGIGIINCVIIDLDDAISICCGIYCWIIKNDLEFFY